MATIYYKQNREWKKIQGLGSGSGTVADIKPLTIKQDGVTVGTYNGSLDTTINLTSTTKVKLQLQKLGNDYY